MFSVRGGHLKWLKHRIDAIEAEKLVCKYSLFESDIAFDKIESVANQVKFEASCDGGCVCKMTSEDHVKMGVEMKEKDIKQGKDKAMGLCKVVEGYVLANPGAYAQMSVKRQREQEETEKTERRQRETKTPRKQRCRSMGTDCSTLEHHFGSIQ
ncbi:hypothetical protein CRG98_033572 [Punica granatum]|uniref:Bet v I/Major latex protein domain-containing protein n=1 Tax=Punica granatum TaxID=22663 RepID=A0A2I0IQQ2_PUNGR|nr:hypothetical protein CRG98_033572 [Punica granatum]